MSDELTVLASPNSIKVMNPTGRPVVLTSVTSPDFPDWLTATGLEGEAQALNPGESWPITIAPNIASDSFHVEVNWIDEDENRRTRTVRLRP